LAVDVLRSDRKEFANVALADRCDAVLRIGGESRGADQEVEHVRRRGGSVFRSIDELPMEKS
jgi:hypothetical protein